MSKQIEQHVLQFYEPKKLLGSGAYGHVWKVIHKQTKQTFALKKIFDAFQNSTDAQRTYRQISLLHQMQHRNIIKLHNVIKANNKRDLYLVFEYMQSDLHCLVGQSILNARHITFILFQALKVLKYMHSAQLIHRDLKPSNILINNQCEIKICDFGLARSLAHEENQQNILSQDVATRWYRSPEILLSSQQYGKPTDVWSLGCIVAQLLISEPIFPGDSTINQLQKIIEFTGIPSKQNIDSLKSDIAQNIINNIKVRKRPVQQFFRKCGNQASQLISLAIKMLDFNPNKRPTVEQMLQNQIFQQFKETINEEQQICQKFIMHQIDDNTKLVMQQYRKIIYKDIQRRYPEFNDPTRMKGIGMIDFVRNQKKKYRSLIQKKHQKLQNHQHNHSFLSKSLPKTTDQSLSSSANKNSSLNKKDFTSNQGYKCEIRGDYIKSKFYKANKQNKELSCENLIQNFKKYVKAQEKTDKTKDETNGDDSVKDFSKKQLKANNQSNQHKQTSSKKKYMIEQQEKAQIYKAELRRMRSTQKLIKSKTFKPKFIKPTGKILI